jgi:hypothetical protein
MMHVRGASSTATSRVAYSRRLLQAKRRMMEQTHGRAYAACFDVLQRAAAVEHAIVYRLIEFLWPTTASRRRGMAAWQSGLAAIWDQDTKAGMRRPVA